MGEKPSFSKSLHDFCDLRQFHIRLAHELFRIPRHGKKALAIRLLFRLAFFRVIGCIGTGHKVHALGLVFHSQIQNRLSSYFVYFLRRCGVLCGRSFPEGCDCRRRAGRYGT